MALFVISYDLIKTKNYDRLIKAIKAKYPTYANVVESTWLVNTNSSAAKIRDALIPFIDDDDKLVVCGVRDMAWTRTIGKRIADWIHDQYKRNAA